MKWLKEIISASSGRLSSKRVCGVLGWLVILGGYIYCIIVGRELPDITDILIWAIVALLGVDSVTGAFKRTPLPRLRRHPHLSHSPESYYEEPVEENETVKEEYEGD